MHPNQHLFKFKTEEDCRDKRIKNDMYIKEEHCYAKEETENFSNNLS